MGRQSGDSRSLSGVDPEHSRRGSQRSEFNDSVLAINVDAETPFLPGGDSSNGSSSDEETRSSSTTLSPVDAIPSSQGWATTNKNYPRVLSKIVLEPPHLVNDSKEEPTKLLISHSDDGDKDSASSRSTDTPTPVHFSPCSIGTQVRNESHFLNHCLIFSVFILESALIVRTD